MSKKPDSVGALSRGDARQSPRHPASLNAQIAIASSGAFPVTIQNISASGALVHAAGVTLDVGAMVELVLPYRRKGSSFELRIPATVVRREQDKVALRFGRYDSDLYTELIELIYSADLVA